MYVGLNEDQRAIRDALEAMARPYRDAPVHDAPCVASSIAFAKDVAESGFLDVASDPDLGTASAGVVVEGLARLPFALEAGARAFFGPLTGDTSRPICLVEGVRTGRLVRYLEPGACVIVVEEAGVSCFTAGESQVRAEPESLYACPMGTLLDIPAERDALPITACEARARWRAALAAECAGLMAAALESTCAHLSERAQFGRKLATFQALRHRLAEAQVRTNGLYWMAMKAAATLDPADAALVAWHAQETASVCVYDFHQFLGAMGMTLEHPLHFWTYRLKALIGELGGRGANAAAAADALWGVDG